MGRGRAKAKQQKVARDLKYNGPKTDFTALQRELGSGGESDPSQADEELEDDYDDADGWASAR